MASQKKKTFYIERTDFSMRFAKVAANGDGAVIEEVRAITPGSAEEVKAFVQDFAQTKTGQMMRARCAIYPEKRVFRHCSLKDAAKPADPRTLEEIIISQFKIRPDQFSLAALNADDGSPYDGSRSNRDVIVCGAPRDALLKAQDLLVQSGIYPLGLEIGSVAATGLLLNQLKSQAVEEPVLVLEIDTDRSNMVVLNRGRVDSARPISLGLNSMIAGVREELGLKDEGAARRLFFSDSFDFREMGPRLVERLLRELQSMIGFYEVQTGQSLGRMTCTLLPPKLSWLNQTFASSLGMRVLEADAPRLLAAAKLRAEADAGAEISHGLLGLMLNQ
jgi:hypothetical protein